MECAIYLCTVQSFVYVREAQKRGDGKGLNYKSTLLSEELRWDDDI